MQLIALVYHAGVSTSTLIELSCKSSGVEDVAKTVSGSGPDMVISDDEVGAFDSEETVSGSSSDIVISDDEVGTVNPKEAGAQ